MVELWLSWGFEKSTGVKLFTSQDLHVICLEYWSDQLRSKITSLIFNPITYGRRGASKMIIYCSLIYVCIDLKLLDYTKISKTKNLVIILGAFLPPTSFFFGLPNKEVI